MKLHLPKALLTALIVAVMPAAYAAVTDINGYTVGSSTYAVEAGESMKLTRNDGNQGAVTLNTATYNVVGDKSRVTVLQSSDMSTEKGTLIFAKGTLENGTSVAGGQLFMNAWDYRGTKGVLEVSNNLVLGVSNWHENNGTVRFHEACDKKNILLSGTVTLVDTTDFRVTSGSTKNYVSGVINGAGQTLEIGGNGSSSITLAGGGTIGTLDVATGVVLSGGLTYDTESGNITGYDYAAAAAKTYKIGALTGSGKYTIEGNATVILGSTINSGTLSIVSKEITVGEGEAASTETVTGKLVVESWAGFDGDLDLEGVDTLTENGLISRTGTYAVKGSGATLAQGSYNKYWYKGKEYNIADGYNGDVNIYVTAEGEVILGGEFATEKIADADFYALNGGTLKLAEGKLSKDEVIYSSGSVNLSEDTTFTGLSANDKLIGVITGVGTIEITSGTDWNQTIATKANTGEDAFTGTTYVKTGRFTYDSTKLGSVIHLGTGAEFQVNGGGSLNHDLVLDPGEHQIHINGSNTFKIVGKSISGAGVFSKNGPSGTIEISGDTTIANYKNTAGTTNLIGGSVTNLTTAAGSVNVSGGSVTTLNASGGTTNVSGGSVTTLNASGTTNVSGGSVTMLNVTGSTTNVSGGTLGHLNATGGTTNLTGTMGFAESSVIHTSGDYKRYSGIYAKGSTVNIGNGTDICTITVPRVEMSDGSAATLNVKQNATLVVTAGDASGNQAYWRHGFILGEWNGATTMNVAGALLVKNAHIAHGDNTGIITIESGALVAAKGIHGASHHDGPHGNGRIDLNLKDGGTLILGEGGINVSNMTAVLGAGTIGISDNAVIAENLALSSSTGTTFDTQKYVWGEGGASITQGAEGGTLNISGVISDHSLTTTEGEGDAATTTTTNYPGKLVKDGAGTLTLSGANTYSGGTTIKKGILALSGNGTLGTGLVTIEKDGTLQTNGSAATMTVTGAGAIDLGNTTALNATLDSNWTGTVKLIGATLADADLNAYGNENSTVQLNSSTGSLKAGDVNTKVELKGGPAFKVTETTGKTVTFNNAISGDANFVVEATANTGTDTYVFKGDVSNWKKATDAKQDVGFIAASDTNVKYEGDATTINHGIYANAGTLNATIGGEKAVTMNGDISNRKWDNSTGELNLTVANSSATGVTFNNAVKADSITVNSNSKATFNNQAEATALTVGEKATATFTHSDVKLTNVTLEKDSSMTATNLTIAEGGSLIFGNGTSLTVTGSLTLDVNSIKLADGFEFATTATQQLISQTGNLTAEAVASWNGGEYVVDGKTYTAGLSMEGGVLSLTLNEVPSKDFVITSVVETFTVEGVEQYMYTPEGTSLTLNVTAGSLAGLKEGGLVELGLISEGMKQALLGDERLTGDEVKLYLSDGTRTIEAGKDAIVGFYNEDHEGYWGKLVGSNRVYEIDRIPEPTTSALSLLALCGLAARRRRRA